MSAFLKKVQKNLRPYFDVREKNATIWQKTVLCRKAVLTIGGYVSSPRVVDALEPEAGMAMRVCSVFNLIHLSGYGHLKSIEISSAPNTIEQLLLVSLTSVMISSGSSI